MTDDEEESARGQNLNQKANQGRTINKLETKLPFSAAAPGQETKSKVKAVNPRGHNEAEELMHAHQQLERVNRGLKPAVGNFSKPLPKDKELLYTQILQSSNKDFQKLFNNQGDGEDLLPDYLFNNNQMSNDSFVMVEDLFKGDHNSAAESSQKEPLDSKQHTIVKS